MRIFVSDPFRNGNFLYGRRREMGECCRNNHTIVIIQQPSRHWKSWELHKSWHMPVVAHRPLLSSMPSRKGPRAAAAMVAFNSNFRYFPSSSSGWPGSPEHTTRDRHFLNPPSVNAVYVIQFQILHMSAGRLAI